MSSYSFSVQFIIYSHVYSHEVWVEISLSAVTLQGFVGFLLAYNRICDNAFYCPLPNLMLKGFSVPYYLFQQSPCLLGINEFIQVHSCATYYLLVSLSDLKSGFLQCVCVICFSGIVVCFIFIRHSPTFGENISEQELSFLKVNLLDISFV